MKEINGFPVWDDEFDKEHFTPNQINESNMYAAVLGALVDARRKEGLTQRELEKRSGVAQPVIARIEKGTTSPNLTTLLKVLAAMGKTLEVVPLHQEA